MEKCNNSTCPISSNCHRWTSQQKNIVTFIPTEISDPCNRNKVKVVCKHQIPKYITINAH